MVKNIALGIYKYCYCKYYSTVLHNIYTLWCNTISSLVASIPLFYSPYCNMHLQFITLNVFRVQRNLIVTSLTRLKMRI